MNGGRKKGGGGGGGGRGGKKMKDKEKFETLKKDKIDKNERKYGKEIREKYGEEVVNKSNHKLMNMTKEKYEKYEKVEKELKETIKLAFQTGDTKSKLAMEMCQLHKEWLMFHWTDYSKEAHLKLTEMYLEDERFTKYYDDIEVGSAKFLNQSMKNYIK